MEKADKQTLFEKLIIIKINLAERSVGAVTLKNFGAERSG
jgi:hypothetical protein